VVTPPVVTPPVVTPPVTETTPEVVVPKDTTRPSITLIGASSITLEVGSAYNDLGATVTDNVDSGLSANITGVVNTGVIGTYTITYSASDRAGNTATPRTRTIRVVDTTRPTITINGSSSITLEQGQTYVEQGATIKDNYDQNLTARITGSINTNTVGTYTITYNATDSSNNSAIPVTRTIQVVAKEVVDTIPPVITLNGSSSINHNVGTTFTDPAATALDNKDGAINVSVTGSVNTAVLGSYTIRYRATDQAGNSSEIIRYINVVDTTPPVITLNGASTITLEVGSVFTDPGSTVNDNYSTNLTASVTGSVNRNLIGTYTLTYSASDSSGNNATQRTRTVNVVDTTRPVITLNGAASITVTEGETFTDPGVTVTDNYTQNIQASVTGAVNTSVPGTYTLTYNAVDSSNNQAVAVTRSIIVEKAAVVNPVIVEVVSTDAKAFTFDKTTGTIVGYDTSFGTNPVIPSTIDGVAVRAIGYQAFRDKGLIGVTLPNNLQSIGENAFRQNQIRSVVIPDSVTAIGNYAFYGNQISEITFGRGLRSTGYYAFSSNQLTELTIPDWIFTVDYSSFSSNRISTLRIGTGVTRIRGYAFYGNSAMRVVVIPSQVTQIDSDAFGVTGISQITIEGTENRFNNTWTQIGFPGNLMPGLNN
jgi:hypothetical protein